MASERSTVFVTITEYTTIYPTPSPTSVASEATPNLTLLEPSLSESANALPSESLVVSIVSSLTPNPTPSSSLQASTTPVVSSLSTFGSLVSSTLSGSSSLPPLPSGWPTPKPPHMERKPNNILPILTLLCMLILALFFLGALIFFAWRFARGKHCPSCSNKDHDIEQLKKRLADKETVTAMFVRNRETLHQRVERGDISREDVLGGSVQATSHSDVSDPFEFDNDNCIDYTSQFSANTVKTASTGATKRMHNRSSTSLARHGMTAHQNRALALDELEGRRQEDAKAQNKEFTMYKRPLFERTLLRSERTNHGRGEAVKRPPHQDWKGKPLRTFDNPGPAPAPPAPVYHPSADHRNPSTYNPAFDNGINTVKNDGDSENSPRPSSDAVPTQYAQPVPREFTEVNPNKKPSRENTHVEAVRQAEGIRNKTRTGGYGALTPIVPPGMDGLGPLPTRV